MNKVNIGLIGILILLLIVLNRLVVFKISLKVSRNHVNLPRNKLRQAKRNLRLRWTSVRNSLVSSVSLLIPSLLKPKSWNRFLITSKPTIFKFRITRENLFLTNNLLKLLAWKPMLSLHLLRSTSTSQAILVSNLIS